MITNVSIEIFAGTSIFLQIIINEMQETSREKTMIQRLTQQKQKRSKSFPSKLSVIQICLSEVWLTIIDEEAMKHQYFGD